MCNKLNENTAFFIRKLFRSPLKYSIKTNKRKQPDGQLSVSREDLIKTSCVRHMQKCNISDFDQTQCVFGVKIQKNLFEF